MRSVCLSLVAVGAILSTGCGVIFNGTHQTIQVQSAPAGAKVETTPSTGTFTTPTQLSLERKSNYTLTFTKDGYSPATFSIQNHAKGGIIVADVLLTGLIGVIIDAATGGWYGLSPEAATVSMTKTALVPGPDTIHVDLARANHGALSVSADVPGVTVQVHQR
jgi:hypothetical protein